MDTSKRKASGRDLPPERKFDQAYTRDEWLFFIKCKQAGLSGSRKIIKGIPVYFAFEKDIPKYKSDNLALITKVINQHIENIIYERFG